jgi:hypothetical protein
MFWKCLEIIKVFSSIWWKFKLLSLFHYPTPGIRKLPSQYLPFLTYHPALTRAVIETIKEINNFTQNGHLIIHKTNKIYCSSFAFSASHLFHVPRTVTETVQKMHISTQNGDWRSWMRISETVEHLQSWKKYLY